MSRTARTIEGIKEGLDELQRHVEHFETLPEFKKNRKMCGLLVELSAVCRIFSKTPSPTKWESFDLTRDEQFAISALTQHGEEMCKIIGMILEKSDEA